MDQVVVLGAGVVGLTSAVALLEDGRSVTVCADRLAPDITSSVAAALWYPYSVSGDHVDQYAVDTLEWYRKLADDPATGVNFVRCRAIIGWEGRKPYWFDENVDFAPADDGFEALLPIADSAILLPWLQSRIVELGGSIVELGAPITHLSDLDGDLIVNCTGIGARSLCGDGALYPVKGTVVLVENPGLDYSLADDVDPHLPTYFIPTSAGLVLGGTADIGQWDPNVDLRQVSDIIRRCANYEPALASARVLDVKTGFRPGRDPLRLEAAQLPDGRTVIHNYGHGGSGYTVGVGNGERSREAGFLSSDCGLQMADC